jgi:hypothetical protein
LYSASVSMTLNVTFSLLLYLVIVHPFLRFQWVIRFPYLGSIIPENSRNTSGKIDKMRTVELCKALNPDLTSFGKYWISTLPSYVYLCNLLLQKKKEELLFFLLLFAYSSYTPNTTSSVWSSGVSLSARIIT